MGRRRHYAQPRVVGGGKDFKALPPKWVEMDKPVWEYQRDVKYGDNTVDLTLGLYRIRHPDDLVTWGRYMGHSGGRYQHWAIDTEVWAFLTLLDPFGFPHCTIHLKDMTWFGKSHPDDGASASIWPWGNGAAPMSMRGRAVAWLPSSMYEDVDWFFRRPIEFEGKQWAVMDASHRDKDKLSGAEFDVINEWYNTVVVPGSSILTPPPKDDVYA